jgi:imidazolonepropionase-like amidohydrolase
MNTRIDAKKLVPGRGEPMENATIVLEDDKISYVGPTDGAPTFAEGRTIVTETVMPGMWECHGHFIGLLTANFDEMSSLRPQLGAMRVTHDARAALHAGFTSVREMGGYGTFLARAVNEGWVEGPNIYASGGMLSQTGGHGDTHGAPLAVSRELTRSHWGEDTICDGPDECRAAVRRMLRLGAKVIKIHASGGVMSELDDPMLPQFSPAELEAIVDEATRMERLVGAHCHGSRGIVAALEAGVMTIEHGTYLDDDAADLMKEKDATLVPTRFIVEYLMAEGKKVGMPEYARIKGEAAAAKHSESVSRAMDKGVRIALGTDIWATGMWGRNAHELSLLVDDGMTNLQALEAATANGPMTLGPQAPNAGQLIVGYDADVICVSGDPTSDVTVLEDTANITHVFKAGRAYKTPEMMGTEAV